MSFGCGVGDMLAISRLAMELYKVCKYSSKQFRTIAAEVMDLKIILDEMQDTLTKDGVQLDKNREGRLCQLLTNAYNALHELQQELAKFDSLTTDRQKKYEVLQWGFKDVGEIRARITSVVSSLNAMGAMLARYVALSPTVDCERQLT
jgi:hypothetical protein